MTGPGHACRVLRLAAVVAGLLTLPAVAQETPAPVPAPQGTPDLPAMGPVRSPILTLDTDRLFGETRFGQRVARDLSEVRDDLARENTEIAAALTEEERSLARRRPQMELEAFRAEAEAFDQKVQRIRAEQDAKERALQLGLVTGRDQFLAAATPVLGSLMRDRGAAVILDRRSVFLGVESVDVTEEAIAAIDEAIGDGSDVDTPDLQRLAPRIVTPTPTLGDMIVTPAPQTPPDAESGAASEMD
jgi:Skp family chaperone for outer membrane proteins